MDGDYRIMALTEEQWMEMYKASIQSSTHIRWIREKLQDNDNALKKCFECISTLKGEQSFLKGYLTRIAIGVTAIFTIVANVVLWAFSYFGGT
jgi:hypothetical protein